MSQPSPRNRTVAGIFYALAATLVWSGNFIVGRNLADAMPPGVLACARWSTAFLIVLPFALRALVAEWGHFKKHIRYYLLTSFIGISFFNTAIYQAAHTTPALNLSLISASSPLFVLLLGRIFFEEPIFPLRFAGICAALTGVVLLLTKGDPAQLLSLSFSSGDLFMLAAAFAFAFYTVLVRKKPAGCGQLSYLAFTFGFGLLILLPLAGWELSQGAAVRLDGRALLSILYIGAGASLFSFWSWGKAIQYIGAARASIVYYSMPFFCGVEAVLFLGEPVLWVHFASGALILGGLLLAAREQAAPNPRKASAA